MGPDKHALMVSYYFPPLGGVPVRRFLRLLRLLPAYGWRCTVLTAAKAWDPHHPVDPDEMKRVPSCERVLRAPARSLPERAYVGAFRALSALQPTSHRPPSRAVGGAPRRLLYETLAFPDPKRGWIRGAVARASRTYKNDPYDLVFATGYPWSAFVVGDRLARRLGRPLVLDYRDAWSLSPRQLWSGPRNRALESAILGRSSAVTTVTEGIRRAMLSRFPQLDPTRVRTVENGFDSAEYPPQDPRLREEDRLQLVYTGTFNDSLPPSRFDRTPFYLLKAVEGLEPEVRNSLRIRLVGRVGPAYRAWARARALEDVVSFEGTAAHRRALQYQVSADVLLLVIYDCPEAGGDMTGKLVEYAGARRPVLALAPEGEAADAIRRHQLGWVVDPTDTEAIAEELRGLVKRWRCRELPKETLGVDALSASEMARKMSRLYDAILETP